MWAVAVVWLIYCWKRRETPFNQSINQSVINQSINLKCMSGGLRLVGVLPHLGVLPRFHLALYHTTATFNDLWERSLVKTLNQKMLVTSSFSFSHNVSTQSFTKIIIWTTFKMSSANAFGLDWSQILSFSKELDPWKILWRRLSVYFVVSPNITSSSW